MFSWDDGYYMLIDLRDALQGDEDMVYAVRLDGLDKGTLYEFPRGFPVEGVEWFSVNSEMNVSIMQQENRTVYSR